VSAPKLSVKDSPNVLGAVYSQAAYYSQGSYYGQASYYNQGSYYSQASYYSQSSYTENSNPTPTATDTETLTISDLEVSGITATTATISWKTNESATGKVYFGTIPSYGQEASDNQETTDHSIVIGSLESGTLYYFKVESANAAGDLASSEGKTFTTSAGTTVEATKAATKTAATSVESGSLWPWFIGLIGLALLLAIIFLLWTRRRKRDHGQDKEKK
jgi:LPXTG-motif cell wall-anchored protein